jgi:hypothetical protein
MYVARLVDRMYYGSSETQTSEIAGTAVADGGTGGVRVTYGMVAIVVLAALTAVVLGPVASMVQETLALGEVLGT